MNVHRLRRKRLPKWAWRTSLFILVGVWAFLTLAPRATSESQVLVAKHTLLGGQHANAKDFETKTLDLGELEPLYAKPHDVSGEIMVLRDAAPGELLPLTSLGAVDFDLVPIALQLEAPISSSIRPGSLVSIWASPGRMTERDGAEQIARSARVSDVRTRTSMNRTSTTLEIWVGSSYVPEVLLALSDGSTISVILEPNLGDAK